MCCSSNVCWICEIWALVLLTDYVYLVAAKPLSKSYPCSWEGSVTVYIKASGCSTLFLTEWFWNCATGTNVANVSLYAEGCFCVFFFFFQELWLIMHFSLRALKLHGLIKCWCKTRKKKPAKCLPKTQNKLAVPVQFQSHCWVQL